MWGSGSRRNEVCLLTTLHVPYYFRKVNFLHSELSSLSQAFFFFFPFKYFLANYPPKRYFPLSVDSLRKNKLCKDTEGHDKNTVRVRNMNQKIMYEGKERKKSKEKNISLLILSLHFIDLSGHKTDSRIKISCFFSFSQKRNIFNYFKVLSEF